MTTNVHATSPAPPPGANVSPPPQGQLAHLVEIQQKVQRLKEAHPEVSEALALDQQARELWERMNSVHATRAGETRNLPYDHFFKIGGL